MPVKVRLAQGRSAAAINAATPLLGLGGEPVRLLWLRAGERKAGLAALVVDRSAYLVSGAIAMAAGVGVGLPLLPLQPWMFVLLAALLLALLEWAAFSRRWTE